VKRLRRLGFGLSSELWLVQVGIFLNFLGWGGVMPFEVIYLHEARGFSLGVAGLVVGTVTGLAVVAAPLAGPLIDRVGSRATAAAALVALSGGFVGLAFAQTPLQALIAAAAAGIGNGALQPSQSTLLASLAPAELRHRVTAVSRVVSNLGIGIGGAIGGLIAAHGLNGFVVLFLVNAATYLLYAAILLVGVREDARPTPIAGGYRLVLRDRPFVRLALTNVAMIAVGWGVFSWIVPAYARGEIGVSTRLIGLMLFANAVTVVLAQIPVASVAEGRRRAVTMAIGALTFVAACLLVLGADLLELRFAAAALLAAVIVVAVGECLHTTVLMPLVADLAPAALRGRYMAVTGLSWWLGLALAPTLAAPLLSVSPPAAMLTAAAVAAAAALSALALEREIPPALRLTPRPEARLPGPAPAIARARATNAPAPAPATDPAMSTCAVAARQVETRTDVPALAAGLVTVVLWGSAFVAIRDAGQTLSPGSLALGRLLVSLVVLGVAASIWREPLPRRRDLLQIGAFGVLFLGVYSVSLNAAERRVDAGTSAMLIQTGPILIAILAAIFLKEGFPRWLFAGCAVAFSGTVLIGLANSQSAPRAGLGIALLIVAAFAYATAVVIQKPVLARVSPLQVTWLACVAGTLVCLPFAPTLVGELDDAGATAIAWTVYLGIAPTALGFATWAFALRRMSAGRLASLAYLIPVVAIGLGWALLAETPPWLAAVGGALCLVGVYLARRS